MIYIKIELWPMGDRKSAKILQEGIIHNTGGTDSIGEYKYLFSKQGGFKGDIATANVKNVLRQGEIKGFPRLRLYAQDLLLRALTLAFGDRANWGTKARETVTPNEDTHQWVDIDDGQTVKQCQCGIRQCDDGSFQDKTGKFYTMAPRCELTQR